MSEKIYDIAIIGGGAAGLTAAIYGERYGLDTVVFERESCGGQIALTGEIENYTGLDLIKGPELAMKMQSHAENVGADFEFEAIKAIEDGAVKILHGEYDDYKAKTVIIAAGVKRRKIGCAGEDKFSGRGVSYCATCDGAFFKGKTVAVVGGGNTALEDALHLSGVCERVYLIHRRDSFRGDNAETERVLGNERITVLWNTVVTEIKGDKKVTSADIVTDGVRKNLPIDGVFVAVGYEPDNSAFSDLVNLEDGFILAGEDCKTKTAGIFAAGDCRKKPLRQIVTACADGAVAANMAAQYIRAMEK